MELGKRESERKIANLNVPETAVNGLTTTLYK
jgi:hypothetical protein